MKKAPLNFWMMALIVTIAVVNFSCKNAKRSEKAPENQTATIKSKVRLNHLGEEVEVVFSSQDGKISNKQNANLSAFLKREKELTEKIKLAVSDYYKSVYQGYRNKIDLANMEITQEQLEEVLPTPTTPDALFKSYKIAQINDEGGTVVLSFNCDWDTENTMQIEIENWQIKHVDTQRARN